MSEKTKILLVEDEQSLMLVLKDRLKDEGYEILATGDGDQAFQLARTEEIDLIILDVMLPGKNGFDICRDLRKLSIDTPILMLTAKSQVNDRIQGLKLGADDYLPKPFEVLELLARVEALLRRARPDENNRGNQAFTFGNIRVNRNEAEVVRDGEQIELSGKEFNLLLFLLENRNTVFSRDELLEHVWGYHDMPCTRTVDMHIANLRSKLERNPKHPKYIITVHGLGYKFTG
jgi:two-component system alkaline phosphatase synthesis response regulator PhoP